jgi:hypothetical protein
MFQFILGAGLAAFTLGGLAVGDSIDQENLLPQPIEALIIGLVFALASAPHRWASVFRVLMPLPAFLLYLSILSGRSPAMPFGVCFVLALFYSLFLTAYTAYIAERSRALKGGDQSGSDSG